VVADASDVDAAEAVEWWDRARFLVSRRQPVGSALSLTSEMAGYWENPEASALTLRGGWLHTGDVGVFDEDGFLTLKDRSKDLIISGGSNIYPREVEEVLLGHPDVAEVSVIARPDPEWGEIPVAYVVARSGVVIDAAVLDKRCLEHIARYKRPRDYCFVEELPKNNYGKLLKTELRRLDAERLQRMHSNSEKGR